MAAECPVGEGARGNSVGPGFGRVRRVSWACTGKRREFRETEVPENAGKSRGKAPTGRAGQKFGRKPAFHPKTRKVPSEGTRKRAVDVPGSRVNDAWESAQRDDASCAPRCGRARSCCSVCSRSGRGAGGLRVRRYRYGGVASEGAGGEPTRAAHPGRPGAICGDPSDAGASADRRGQLAAGTASLLTTSGVRAGRPWGNSSRKGWFTNSGAPRR